MAKTLKELERDLADWEAEIALAKSPDELDRATYKMVQTLTDDFDVGIEARFATAYHARLQQFPPTARRLRLHAPEYLEQRMHRRFAEEFGVKLSGVEHPASDAFLRWKIKISVSQQIGPKTRAERPATQRLLDWLQSKQASEKEAPEALLVEEKYKALRSLGSVVSGFFSDDGDDWRRRSEQDLEERGWEQAWDALGAEWDWDDEKANDPSLPPLGARIDRRDHGTGAVIASCTAVKGGVEFNGIVYPGIRAAAVAAAATLGTPVAEGDDGCAWWGYDVPAGVTFTDRVEAMRSEYPDRQHAYWKAYRESPLAHVRAALQFVGAGPVAVLDSDEVALAKAMVPAIRAAKAAGKALQERSSEVRKGGRSIGYSPDPEICLGLALGLMRRAYPFPVDDRESDKMAKIGQMLSRARGAGDIASDLSPKRHIEAAIDILRRVDVPWRLIEDYLIELGYPDKTVSGVTTRASRMRAEHRATHGPGRPGRPKGSKGTPRKPRQET